jgi:hypothetical protein
MLGQQLVINLMEIEYSRFEHAKGGLNRRSCAAPTLLTNIGLLPPGRGMMMCPIDSVLSPGVRSV